MVNHIGCVGLGFFFFFLHNIQRFYIWKIADWLQHATTAVPRKKGLEDFHVVYTGDNSADQRALYTPSFLWHSDVYMMFVHFISHIAC